MPHETLNRLLEYVGLEVVEQKFTNMSHQFFFRYRFSQPVGVAAYEEYFIYDFIRFQILTKSIFTVFIVI